MTMEQKQLLNHINAVSFAAYDVMLFLDTHPDCMEAKDYYCQMMEERKMAMDEYQKRFEPLVAEGACTCGCNNSDSTWTWATTPWPWERGAC